MNFDLIIGLIIGFLLGDYIAIQRAKATFYKEIAEKLEKEKE